MMNILLINIIKEFEIKYWRFFFFAKSLSRESEIQIDGMIWFLLGKQKMNRNVFEKKYFKMLTVVLLDPGILSCSYSLFKKSICLYYYQNKIWLKYKHLLKNQDLIHLSFCDDICEKAVHDHGLLSCANILFKFPVKDFLRFISFLLLMTMRLTRAIPIVTKNSHRPLKF